MEKYQRTYVTVDLDSVKANFEAMKKNIDQETQMIAVIKADAYGHGAVRLGKYLESFEYIWGFAAATAEEALEIRNAGIKKPILVLGHVFEEYFDELIVNEVRMTLSELKTAEVIHKHAEKIGKTAKLHLALDTGMTRIGMKDTESSIEDVKKICSLKWIEVEGLFTHFARADETDKIYADEQLKRYLRFRDRLMEEQIQIPYCHCSNSAGIIDMPYANLDIVRAGISIYGIYPSQEVQKSKVILEPVMEWKAHISYVKEVEEGVQVSYGGTYTTDKKTIIATVPVGYADGYPRLLSGKGYVLVNGKAAPILGRICMDQFMIDVTDIPHVEKGTEVTLLGKDGDLRISVEQLSELCGRFPYEFVCNISRRVPRIYKES